MAALHRARLRARAAVRRFTHQIGATYANRLVGPVRGKLTVNNLRLALVLAFNVALADRCFFRLSPLVLEGGLPALRRGQIDAALSMGVVGHHLIRFSREALRGEQNASFYSAQSRRSAAAEAAARRLREAEEVGVGS